MDTTTALGSVLAAFGLSGAAGLNAWLPLFVTALLARLGAIDLGAPFGDLSTTPGLVVLATGLALDLVGDKVPAVDSLLHTVGTVVAPISGALLFVGQTGLETELPASLAGVAGALLAGAVHLERAAVRPGATVATAGTANPVVSLVEDAGSALLVVAALLVPVLAFAAVLVVLVTGFVAVRRVRRALGARRAAVRR